MRILIISNIELSDTNAAGNTFANWLTGWPDTEVSSIYSRDAIPHNDFCSSYYCISPISVLKNLLTPRKIGKYFKKTELPKNESSSIEASLIKNTKRGYLPFLNLLYDLIISSRIWQNKRYREFIKDYHPDIVFSFAKSEAFLYQNLKYIKKHTSAKIVYFFADDMYSIYQQNGLLKKIFLKRFLKLITLADKNYGASQLLCEIYSNLFNINITPLYKGCLIGEPKKTINRPIRIVYAGNLYYGREKTLAIIAKALKNINSNGQIAALEIYTNAVITPEVDSLLNIKGSSMIMGSRPFDVIQKIMKESDVVLHVESFDPKDIKIVRLSYSTKMSDCLQSGAMMMIVGPNGIASVEEGKLIDGVEVISDERRIEPRLREIISNHKLILDATSRTNAVAKEKFPISIVRKRLHDDFVNMLNR